jgi:hypothetical protein
LAIQSKAFKNQNMRISVGRTFPVITVAAAKYSSQLILPTGIGVGDLAKKGFRRLLGAGNDGVLLLLLQYFFHGTSVDRHDETLLDLRPASAERI